MEFEKMKKDKSLQTKVNILVFWCISIPVKFRSIRVFVANK